MNGKEETVIGMAVNNRIGIQTQAGNRRVSIQILNLRYQEGPGKPHQTLYFKVVQKAHAEIALLNEGLKAQIRTTGNKHVDTAHLRYSLGRALWLSNKPLETTQSLKEFQAAIMFLKQHEPTHHSLKAFEKARDLAQKSVTLFQETGKRSACPYWRLPTSRREDKRAMIDHFRELLAMAGRERETTITANTMQQGLRRHGLHGFTSPTPDPVDRTTFKKLACDEIDRIK